MRKDYYKILGLQEGASEKKIRARWMELIKFYSSDLGRTEEEDERVREINEAYEILRRSVIKKAHRRKEKRMNIQKIILPSGILVLFLIVGLVSLRWFHVVIPPKSEAPYEGGKVLEKETASKISPVETGSNVQAEKEVPKEIIKSQKIKEPKEIKKEGMGQESKKIVSVSPQRSPSGVRLGSKKKEESASKILPKSNLPVKVGEKDLAKGEPKPAKELVPQVAMKSGVPVRVEREVPKEVSPQEVPKEVRKEVPKEVPKELPKEVPKEVTGVTLHAGEKLTIKREGGEADAMEISKVVPRESSQMDKPKIAVLDPQPVQKPGTSVKAEKVVSFPPPSLVKEEEVKRFFSNYIDRYHQKDIDGFLSFFSSEALQNQKDGLEAIRNIYTKFFDQSQELRYRVEGMKIGIYQNAVEVRARFRVGQTLKRRGGEKVWTGTIHWVLVKEDGALKIISLNYQNQKST